METKKSFEKFEDIMFCQSLTLERSPGKKSFKEVLLSICDKRSDVQSDEVRVRIAGALSDLHAVDAR